MHVGILRKSVSFPALLDTDATFQSRPTDTERPSEDQGFAFYLWMVSLLVSLHHGHSALGWDRHHVESTGGHCYPPRSPCLFQDWLTETIQSPGGKGVQGFTEVESCSVPSYDIRELATGDGLAQSGQLMWTSLVRLVAADAYVRVTSCGSLIFFFVLDNKGQHPFEFTGPGM